MKPKFTPKPWHVEDCGWVDERGDTLFIYGPDNHGSPHVMVGVSHNSDESRIEPNANLIAAAPEMYDALEEITNMCILNGLTIGRVVDAILAKVRGES